MEFPSLPPGQELTGLVGSMFERMDEAPEVQAGALRAERKTDAKGGVGVGRWMGLGGKGVGGVGMGGKLGSFN